jgi:PGF-pre-PGF domain-containing protein
MKLGLVMAVLLVLPLAFAAAGDTSAVSKVWNGVEVGDSMTGEFRLPGLSLRDITVTFTDRADPAKVTVQGRSTKPVLAPESDIARIYQYVDITTNLGTRANVDNVIFYLPREWVESLTLENPEIVLQWRQGNNWTDVPINVTPSEDWFEVRASVPVLDDFVIGANRPKPVEEVIPIPEPEQVVTPPVEPVVNDTNQTLPPADDVVPPVDDVQGKPFQIPVFVWIILGVIVLIGLIVLVLEGAARRRSKAFK